MIRVLLVEDEAPKRQLLAAALDDAGVADDQLVVVGSVFEAKRALKAEGFDLMLLDINLPQRPGREAAMDGGLEVLRWLKGSRGSAHRPPYIIGTTAFDSAFHQAEDEFDNLIWTLIRFEFSNNGWKSKLDRTVRHIAEQIHPPYPTDGASFKADLGIVVALNNPELAALEAASEEWTRIPVRHDQSPYYSGVLKDGARAVRFVATCATEKGLTGAATATSKLIYAFWPRRVAMVGICAGVRGRTNMGDVVFADPCWDWGSGKLKTVDKQDRFLPASYQMRLPEDVRPIAEALKKNSDWRQSVHAAFGGKRPDVLPEVHIGALASGASVLQSHAALDGIISQHKDLLAVEMEIYGVMYACRVGPLPRPECFAVKSVCDFGDAEKADDYQAYAAYVSVAAMKAIVLEGFAEDPD
jgi:nucleoside phosphorylase